MIAGRRVVLGVSGGIAIYKSCTIARRLTEAGGVVDVVMTAAAGEFVRPATFEALTGRPVVTSLWEPGRALLHIDLARAADLIIVAPATAHLLARAALGLADDQLTAILLASGAAVLAAPAMNDSMFAHPATQENLATLRRRGWTMLGPDTGPLAEGPSDRPGRMVEPEVVVSYAVRMLRAPDSPLAGRRVVVTAGPTRERLDAVRVLTNPSSGKMGFAIAQAAFWRGADVILISGPTALEPPHGVELVRVESTEDLRAAVAQHVGQAAALVMAAAPADFRPKTVAAGKRPRANGDLRLVFQPTVDVLEATASARAPNCVTVGFALENGHDVDRARGKLGSKRLDLVVLNSAADADAGFEADANRVTLVTESSAEDLPLAPKIEVAETLMDRIEELL